MKRPRLIWKVSANLSVCLIDTERKRSKKDYDEKNLKIQTKIEKNVKAPISKGQALGMVKVIYNDEEYASVVLTSPEAVEADNIKGILKSIWSVISSPKLLVTLGLLLIIFVWSTLIFNRRKQAKIRKSSRNRQ